MPRSWSKKDERQYDEIKKSARSRGKSEDRAEQIAARTVNKRRREEGRTESRTSRGTGNPNTRLDDRSKESLYNRAQELEIRGRSSMRKDELVRAIRSAEGS